MKKKQAGNCLDCGKPKKFAGGLRCVQCRSIEVARKLKLSREWAWVGSLQLKRPDDGVDLNLVAE